MHHPRAIEVRVIRRAGEEREDASAGASILRDTATGASAVGSSETVSAARADPRITAAAVTGSAAVRTAGQTLTWLSASALRRIPIK